LFNVFVAPSNRQCLAGGAAMRFAIASGVILFALSSMAPATAAQPRERERDKGAAPADATQREAGRAARAALAKEYLVARKSAENSALNSLASHVGWLVKLNAKTEAQAMVAEIRDADPKFIGLVQLEKSVGDIAQPAALDEGKKKELASRRATAKKICASGLLDLASRCYRGDLMGYAYDLACDVLQHDPDNETARNAMGQSKSGNKWVTPFEAAAIGRGEVYLKDIGWVPQGQQARYAAGEWQEGGTWMKLADADKLHSNRDKPWTIETDNFILKSTASRKQAVFVAERLEAIRELCFREYLEFFLRGSKRDASRLLFNAPMPKKLVVNYFGSKTDFEQGINALPIPAERKPLLLRSAGFYSNSVHASYFYYDPNFGPFQIVLMQHEVTHQILGEFTGGGCDHPWLSEGVAEVLEAATPQDGGRLVLPHGYDHPDVISAANMLKHNALPAIASLLALDHAAFHVENVRHNNYVVSGALCRFLLEFKAGAYAADFLEYLCDCYRSRSDKNLANYLNMEAADLDKEFRAYLTNCHSGAHEVAEHSPSDESRAPERKSGAGKPADKTPGNNPFERR
jgi:hypothetical protein